MGPAWHPKATEQRRAVRPHVFSTGPAPPDQPVCWSRGGGCRPFAMEEDMRSYGKHVIQSFPYEIPYRRSDMAAKLDRGFMP